MSTTKQVEALFKVASELSHADAPASVKKLSLIECDVTCIDLLLKMKHGAFTSVKLALDGELVSDCVFDFRLLTTGEEDTIDEQMAMSGLSSIDNRYLRKKICLTLSAASVPHPSFKEHTKAFNSPQLPVKDLLILPEDMLFALGYKYREFKQKHSPKLESLTQQQIDDCVRDIEICEADIKKFDLLNTWNLSATHEVIIDLVKQLAECRKQLEAVFTG